MLLPVSVNKIQYYKISGRYCYEGDLVITDGILYFFPFVDLEEKRLRKNMVLIGAGCIIGIWGFLFALIFNLIGTLLRGMFKALQLSSVSSKLRSQNLWSAGDSSETLQGKLDAYIGEIKNRNLTLSSAMPAPNRFPRDSVHNLRFSFMGELSFEAQSDRHDFNIGVVKKAGLREALKQSGFMDSELFVPR